MATQLQIRRGTAAQCDSFIGAEGEITVDTTNKSIRIHDGTTAGGRNIPTFSGKIPTGGDYVIESQLPAAGNNYTWYRLYNSGWIEQGGLTTGGSTSAGALVSFPVAMSDLNYQFGGHGFTTSASTTQLCVREVGSTRATNGVYVITLGNNAYNGFTFYWKVEGIAA